MLKEVPHGPQMPGDRQGRPGRPQCEPFQPQDEAALSAQSADLVAAVGRAGTGAAARQRRGGAHDREERRHRRIPEGQVRQPPVARDPPIEAPHHDRCRGARSGLTVSVAVFAPETLSRGGCGEPRGTRTRGTGGAAQLVAAQTVIKTDTAGLEAGEVKVPAKDREIPAYRAMPDKGGPFPTVLVASEIWGVHEYIQDVCRRLAKAGYFAIAPELFVRQGNPAAMSDNQAIMRDIIAKVPDDQLLSDFDATVAYAKASGKADTAKLAMTGFCRGGRYVWIYAAHNPGLKAAVPWYGHLDIPRTELQPKQPIDLAAELKAPVLGLYGGAD